MAAPVTGSKIPGSTFKEIAVIVDAYIILPVAVTAPQSGIIQVGDAMEDAAFRKTLAVSGYQGLNLFISFVMEVLPYALEINRNVTASSKSVIIFSTDSMLPNV